MICYGRPRKLILWFCFFIEIIVGSYVVVKTNTELSVPVAPFPRGNSLQHDSPMTAWVLTGTQSTQLISGPWFPGLAVRVCAHMHYIV